MKNLINFFLFFMQSHFIGAAIGAVGAIGGALISKKGASDRNDAAEASSAKQMEFQERMSNTAHQRQVADLRKAGLNPILSSKYGGASTPQGSMYNPIDELTPAVNAGLNVGSTISNINTQRTQQNVNKATEALTDARTAVTKVEEELKSNLVPGSQALSQMTSSLNNLISAIKGRVDTSTETFDATLEEASGVVVSALESVQKFVGTDIGPTVDKLREAVTNYLSASSSKLKNASKAQLDEVLDFIMKNFEQLPDTVKNFLIKDRRSKK